jgi:hypothetical protein
VAVFAFYFALAVAMTWPLAAHLDTALADLGDPILVTWILDWVCHALTTNPFGVYHPPIFHPSPNMLAASENLIGVALLVLPFHVAGAPPIVVYNIALLIGFALSGYGMFVLARLVTGNTIASLIAGMLFAFAPFKFDHLSHLQIISSGWLPLLLAALLHYWRKPSMKSAALIAGAFVMNPLTNVYYFLFAAVTCALTTAWLAITTPNRGRRFWLQLAGAFVVGGIVLLPFLLPYRWLAKTYGMVRSEGEAISGSAPAISWLVTTPRNIVYGKLGPDELHRHEMQLFPGLVAILLAIAGAVLAKREASTYSASPPRRTLALNIGIVAFAVLSWMGAITDRIEWTLFGRRILSFNSAESFATILVILLVVRFRHRLRDFHGAPAMLWIVIGILGSFGMHLFFHAFLYKRIGIFQAIRAPVRWAVIAYIGLAVWAAIGATALMQKRRWIGGLLLVLAAIDVWPRIRWEHAVPTTAPVYRWLNEQKVAPIIELPMANGMEFAFLYGATAHHLPQFNGYQHFGAPLQAALRTKNDANAFDDEFLSLLEQHGGKLVIVHGHLAPPKLRAWLAAQLAKGRLAFVRNFDHEIGGDWVFAITRNFADWPRIKQAETPDGAGFLPAQRLQRMLAGQPVHSDAITYWIDTPQPYETIKGPLHLRGWTLSPFSIKRVTMLLHNGSVRIEVPLNDARPDVKRDYGWYYFVERPGFDLRIEKPEGVPRATEFQLEIEDERRTIRTADILIQWEEAQ